MHYPVSESNEEMSVRSFTLKEPLRRRTSIVFASPHSGDVYPESFLRRTELDTTTIRSSADSFVDRIFASAPDFGAPLLAAVAPRAYVDLNRASDEFDSALIEGVKRATHNPRVVSGLGVIPRVVANGRAIYRGKISIAEANKRIEDVWLPYHAKLQSLLDENRRDFGEAVLIDCHSMPHEALSGQLSAGQPPEIVLGDRFGASAAPRFVERVEAAFVRAGFRVARNSPFAGAYSTQAYGRPTRSQHAIQIEIDRSLYMDETTITPRADFDAFCARMRSVVADIAYIGRKDIQVAAE